MGNPSAAMQDLTQQLFAFEEKYCLGLKTETTAAIQVIEKLRIMLTRFSGQDSFTALMRRAIALFRLEHPTIEIRTTSQFDSIASFEGLSDETTLMVTAHLLDLMSTFVGHALTLRLLAETWPLDDLKGG